MLKAISHLGVARRNGQGESGGVRECYSRASGAYW
jgi:hypothetical protein